MHSTQRRNERSLKAELSRNMGLFFFDRSEITSVLEYLDTLQRGPKRKALALCVHLSNMSANIVPKIVQRIREASAVVQGEALEKWISAAFDLLDAKGLEPAVRFLSLTDRESLGAFLEPPGLPLRDVTARLETYLRAISGMDIAVGASAGPAYTDTARAYLPPVMKIFADREKNFLAYKLLAAHIWGQMESGTFLLDRSHMVTPIKPVFEGIEERALALDLYRILEAVRVEEFLRIRLPGLVRDAGPIKRELLKRRPPLHGMNDKTAFVERLYRQYLAGKFTDEALSSYRRLESPDITTALSLHAGASSLKGGYSPLELDLACAILPQKVAECLALRKNALRKRLRGVISQLLTAPDLQREFRKRAGRKRPGREMPGEKKFIVLRGALMEVDEELGELIEENGGIPGAVMVDGSEAGSGRVSLRSLLEEEEETAETPSGGIPYDEWDYRRNGYRKGWCSLYEHDVHSVDEPFVEQTLLKYGGYVTALRKRFELLRNETRLLKRQKEGEDIDIDAAVEALSDLHAGRPPGENLFTRLERRERNIATLFLLDMSGSTKGWINVAEKEALVLMSEALESLRDSYAIYGFSGVTRRRCDFYRVKGFGEAYSDMVKKRIAGILPRDYTRMGPAIRHSTEMLRSVGARTKLLITLSDGKPEDYDAYKGAHGIEDTRMALIEAKQQAVHSFCITIDREAHEYLPHMYGEVNYAFIDDVRKLPSRITEIYAKLTT